ncbi:HAMP domain-containing sensor histidine kinase [Fictibacillus enclensis]|uniref:sensor histidine kinase n=1 Tax=Fictibacillus enclensis TaxID=1017270 RepID=UPI0025A12C47|nr:HAMP domain-containing sensor histidine kinase [Fictibacillus enclensis]MDM5198356.1 HAMP domain-containing sensor histidine kinase [Fictibacillus enclensis]
MFQRTHRRLTLLNSIVFIILLSLLGALVYSYTRVSLYNAADHSIDEELERLPGTGEDRNHHEKARDKDFMARDSRVTILVWDENHNLLDLPRPPFFVMDNVDQYKQVKMNKLEFIHTDDATFRSKSIKEDIPLVGTVTVQAIRNVKTEEELLKRLLIVIITGCLFVAACAIGGGYFLAGRALVPIKKAWDKQQKFVSDASHELRTPLSVIQAKTDLLFRSPSATIEEKSRDISAISKESRRLTKLVSQLLLLARSDSNQVELNKQTFQLDQLLSEIVEHYGEIASYQGKNISLQAEGPIAIHADKERIHQLVIILLDNAMKHTGDGDQILLSVKEVGSSVELKVKDNGPGIAEHEKERIFDRFYQSDQARSDEEGLGLGLSIAKWIIEKHEGKIKVESEHGKGTAFILNLPK